MRRIIALLLIIAAVSSFSACDYKVENEANAEKVYKCSSDNMFGLEKVVVFKDGIVLVFDKETSDSSEYVNFVEVSKAEEYYEGAFRLRNKNNRRVINARGNLVEENGKYIASAFFYDDEDTTDFVINGMVLFGNVVEVNDGNIMLQYEDVIPDAFVYERQYFDPASDEWGKTEKDYTPAGTGDD